MIDKFSKMILTLAFVMFFVCCMNTAKAQPVKEGLVSLWTLDKDTINGKTVEDVIGKNDLFRPESNPHLRIDFGGNLSAIK